MEISNARHQVMAAHQLEQVLAGFNCPKNLDPHHQHQQLGQQGQLEKKLVRPPNPEQALKCPRCESSNTKFCYYNNYSLTQPRVLLQGLQEVLDPGGIPPQRPRWRRLPKEQEILLLLLLLFLQE
ncbi:uncharacterized protein M6B38_153185 [Iris pallida]|uniref:Dof-type domain-containing protein n=1 Tax=Iris pallida TaxID=29817 RepID=A0AAX6F532_IRIPA|nr:uncharacterized protein M6B38_153185 [Iris pallida]